VPLRVSSQKFQLKRTTAGRRHTVSSYYFVWTHTSIYVSSYYYVRVLILLCMCPHTILCVLILLYVLSYYYICVLILLYLCPHTPICVLICYICVLIMLCVCQYVSSYQEAQCHHQDKLL
jgi:hypothetical protein